MGKLLFDAQGKLIGKGVGGSNYVAVKSPEGNKIRKRIKEEKQEQSEVKTVAVPAPQVAQTAVNTPASTHTKRSRGNPANTFSAYDLYRKGETEPYAQRQIRRKGSKSSIVDVPYKERIAVSTYDVYKGNEPEPYAQRQYRNVKGSKSLVDTPYYTQGEQILNYLDETTAYASTLKEPKNPTSVNVPSGMPEKKGLSFYYTEANKALSKPITSTKRYEYFQLTGDLDIQGMKQYEKTGTINLNRPKGMRGVVSKIGNENWIKFADTSKEFRNSVIRTTAEKPIETYGTIALGATYGLGSGIIASTGKAGLIGVKTFSSIGSGIYIGSTIAGTIQSKNKGAYLGREFVRASSFGLGASLGGSLLNDRVSIASKDSRSFIGEKLSVNIAKFKVQKTVSLGLKEVPVGKPRYGKLVSVVNTKGYGTQQVSLGGKIASGSISPYKGLIPVSGKTLPYAEGKAFKNREIDAQVITWEGTKYIGQRTGTTYLKQTGYARTGQIERSFDSVSKVRYIYSTKAQATPEIFARTIKKPVLDLNKNKLSMQTNYGEVDITRVKFVDKADPINQNIILGVNKGNYGYDFSRFKPVVDVQETKVGFTLGKGRFSYSETFANIGKKASLSLNIGESVKQESFKNVGLRGVNFREYPKANIAPEQVQLLIPKQSSMFFGELGRKQGGSSMVKLGQPLLLKSGLNYSQRRLIFNEKINLVPAQKYVNVQKIDVKQEQKIAQIQKIQTIYAPSQTVYTQINVPNPEVRVIIPSIYFRPKTGGFDLAGTPFKSFYSGFKTSYTPSFGAVSLGIYGKPNLQGARTGIGLRPISMKNMRLAL